MLFADVILPLPVPGMFTYKVPEALQNRVEIGKRVVVQFGSRKLYAAIIAVLHHTAPQLYKPKSILDILDDQPVVYPANIAFWRWVADYYMCSIGEVMHAALPPGLKLDSETTIALHPAWDESLTDLDNEEFIITETLRNKHSLTLNQVEKITGTRSPHKLIKSLIEKNAVFAFETFSERYKPKTKTVLHLAAELSDESRLGSLLDELQRAPRQHRALLAFLEAGTPEPDKSALLSQPGVTAAAVRQLIQKGILQEKKITVDRLPSAAFSKPFTYELNVLQQRALEEIRQWFQHKNTVLLHGVNASGKTFVYTSLIKETLHSGRQALLLLPEIAMSTQTLNRLQELIGPQVGIYHSGFGINERVEIWNKLLRKDYSVIIGTRSAVFLPFDHLGLVIIDEEQDASYRQSDAAPGYHARDTAIALAYHTGAKTLLGSSVPSVDSYQNARTGKYGFVSLRERYDKAPLPKITVVNLREEIKKRRMQSVFSWTLLEAIKQTLARNEQVILFKNRRGFAPYLSCHNCGWIPKCISCDVSLSFFKERNILRCHYCGYASNPITQCPKCGSADIRLHGFGTEKAEEDIKICFPDSTVGRLDYDAARTRAAGERILQDFEQHHIDILVGTQMIVRAMEADSLTLTAILSADQLLGFPDFRVNERAFQFLEQLAGKAARKDRNTHIIIQAFDATHPLLEFAIRHDFEGFFYHEIPFRKKFSYPPFSRLIRLTFKHRNKDTAAKGARHFLHSINNSHPYLQLLGPAPPFVERMKNLYLQQILIKIKKTAPLQQIKTHILQNLKSTRQHPGFKSLKVEIEVDP
ncbi:MAG: primosomal protein N' [Chitinophagales bacterium]|nr:MAG: primosomal protein N' [Chitinophagales bacterium]